MSPNLIHFKAHPRGFDGGINWTSGDIKRAFLGGVLQGKKRRTRDIEIGMETP